MKTIKEAAHEYFRKAQLGLENPGSESGFIAGVEFAQRWISVEDELPEDENKESDFSVCVLAKDMHGKTMSAYYHFQKRSFYSNAFSKSELIGITHWRPIKLK